MRPPIEPTESGSCLLRTADGTWDGDARPIANVADPVETQDAATKAMVDSATAAVQTTALWIVNTSTVMADPTSGRVRFNHDDIALVTEVAIAALSANSTDVSQLLGSLRAGDPFNVQDQDDATRFGKYTVSGATVGAGTWWRVPVTFKSGGATFIQSGNQELAIVITHYPVNEIAALEARVASLEQAVAAMSGPTQQPHARSQ
jgi:hypothetical protein